MIKKLVLVYVVVFAFATVSARSQEEAAAPQDAKTIYASKCALCHGKEGKGDTKMGQKNGVKDFTDAKYQASFTDEKAAKDIKDGIKEGEAVKMTPFGKKLTDADIKGLLEYIRAFAPKAEAAK